ncbi:VanW family protein [Oscillochloris trichoides DG-6]|uniref:VanW family protein n=1 Tax=Oscillochloris trichoides DG-6 TaxID=765420 RepID=E1IBW7_9CHLR|nr:VanW family protein [Oscillochloris trichoides DG-6]
MTLAYTGAVWRPTLAELGLMFDPALLADQAVGVGRRGDPMTCMRELWQIFRTGMDLTPRVLVDQRQLQNYVLQVARDVERPPQDAALSIAGAKVVGIPSTPGIPGLG